MPIDHAAIEQTLSNARECLLRAAASPGCASARGKARGAHEGHWEGRLSSSALATATAVFALELYERSGSHSSRLNIDDLHDLIGRGLTWLVDHQNEDGGWGDTIDSPSNISTTTLCWAALAHEKRTTSAQGGAVRRAETWLTNAVGDLTAPRLAKAISRAYGKDRTFAVPILTMCALAGRLGPGRQAWRMIPVLPFELAACPHTWFRWLRLRVVSYALPALIAIGQAHHFHCPTRNPLTRCLRNLVRERTLRVLQSIQPATGGFLEAAPLTSFVLMSMVSIGLAAHRVAESAVGFLLESAREDASWPIDTNLATWVTTLSVNALALGGDLDTHLSADHQSGLRAWLLGQQHRREHPYTHAAPGGWAWTDRSGGVPDADDTPGALLALWNLADRDESGKLADPDLLDRATEGIRWLLDLQNADGGIPTFCRGWGKLPFDRSSPDLTAHTLRAFTAWRDFVPDDLRQRIDLATPKAIRYLIEAQRPDGSWVPLWFGNQQAAGQENPLYGTTRVLLAGASAKRLPQTCATRAPHADSWSRALGCGMQWLLSAQNENGGWGGAPSTPSSIEETALAVEALASKGVSELSASGGSGSGCRSHCDHDAHIIDPIERGCAWLIERTQQGTRFDPSPIGLYFARLWYSERLYPLIFTVSALQCVHRLQS